MVIVSSSYNGIYNFVYINFDLQHSIIFMLRQLIKYFVLDFFPSFIPSDRRHEWSV